jgi:hypothetical protein
MGSGEASNHSQVKGLVYVAAGAPDSGQSFADWRKDYTRAPGAAEIKPYGEGYVALTAEGVRKHFVQDVPSEEADPGSAGSEVLRRQDHGGGMALQTKLVHRRSTRPDHSSRCRARFREPNGCRDSRAGKLACADAFSARCRCGIHRQSGSVSVDLGELGGARRNLLAVQQTLLAVQMHPSASPRTSRLPAAFSSA